MSDSPHFLLVGNGPYSNRGCEAIVRGTMVILRHEFGEKFRVTLGSFGNPDAISDQAVRESDPLISHVALRRAGPPIRRWSVHWCWNQFVSRMLPTSFDKTYSMLDPFVMGAACALQIGGDNYTLDYGKPRGFMALDDYLHCHDVPVVLWGASVGPFEGEPAFSPKMFSHLRGLEAVLVREPDSYDYLKQHGCGANLHRMCDPAFLMEPVEASPEKIGGVLPADCIGLNLSPLMARYVTGGDVEAWSRIGAAIVEELVKTSGRNVVLVPHVTCGHTNDHDFLCRVRAMCANSVTDMVSCLGAELSAAETKWCIGRCAAFIGARTHATIGAISSCVPTLSLAYSRKAIGLNQEVFGSQKYCIQPAELTPSTVSQGLASLLAQRDAIHEHLVDLLPKFRANAFRGGEILRQVIE